MRAHGQVSFFHETEVSIHDNDSHDTRQTRPKRQRPPEIAEDVQEFSPITRPADRPESPTMDPAFSRLAVPETKRAASPGGTLGILGQDSPKSTKRRAPIRDSISPQLRILKENLLVGGFWSVAKACGRVNP
jgi:hypothetical protein